MKKKILTAVVALSVVATSSIAQTKTLSAPSKTETTAPKTTSSPTTTQTDPTDPTSQMKPKPGASQMVTPPDAVVLKFKSIYPSVQGVKWLQNKQTNYVAMFKNNGVECRSVFKTDGTLVREAKTIQQSALPPLVSSYLTQNFEGKTPKKFEEMKEAGGAVIYIIKYDDKLVRLNSEGKEVKQPDDLENNK